MAGKRSISTAELKAECTTLERALRAERRASDDELGPHRPGGAENPGRDAYAWLSYYRHLHRLHATGSAGSGHAAPASHEQADAMVLDALRAEPIPVRRLDAAADEPSLYVYAKSLDALLRVDALDRQLRYMTRQRVRLQAAMEARPSAHLAELLEPMAEAISYTYQLLAWIVTSPGPEMPYPPDDERPEPPAAIRALTEWDIIRICQAHQQHLHRLAGLAALLDADREDGGEGRRPSWSGFVAGVAMEHDADPEHLMKHRAFAALLAAARLDANAKAPKKSEGA